ncbi:MAG: beta-N-acetylhexosaminidase [Acidobacteriales bacterium 13_2_20CM_55_8]|nr:MAG: beta-N-acetylhexosaminidase [Acidobacteriales bacterium 13_2_20CM_55_8]
MRTIFILLMLCSVPMPMAAQPQAAVNLMPIPTNLRMGTGRLAIDPSFSVAISANSDPRLQRAVERFLNDLRRQTGMLPVNVRVTDASKATLVIRAEHANKEVLALGEDESYSLDVTSSSAKLEAPTTLGALHGLQTFLQLVATTTDGFAVPALSIQDKPRFPWRGLLIDVGRHFIPLDVLKRNLDGMAAVKLNVLHWHLSENQGFRVESKKFPKLHEMGSDGLFYTQDEIRDLIAYAQERGIRVMPEFDMPGHSTAWFVGYPELASAPGPYQIERKWGVFDPAMDPTQERTYKFLDDFIGEMAGLFPDQYFHIGGDEVNGKQWEANPKIQEFKRSHGIKNNEDLQAYFNKRVQEIVSKHGKTMVGWDEILRPDLPKNIVVQSWRGQESLAAAAKQGYRGLLSHGYYVDLMWSAERHYSFDPLGGPGANLTPEEKQRVLGGEACMWGEYVSPENIDSRIWPRTAAIAERLWSPQEVRDVNSMYQRMEKVSRKLDWLGLTHNSGYAPMLRRMAGSDNISALRALADVVEPVKDYSRGELAAAEPTSADPLNRLVDAARPESLAARKFAGQVDQLLSGKADADAKAQIRSLLILWRDNQAKLQPLADQSFLLKEVVPISRDLSSLGSAGLSAMDYLESGQHAPADWATEQRGLVEEAKKPKAQLLLMIAPSIQRLIQASAGQATGSSSNQGDR